MASTGSKRGVAHNAWRVSAGRRPSAQGLLRGASGLIALCHCINKQPSADLGSGWVCSRPLTGSGFGHARSLSSTCTQQQLTLLCGRACLRRAQVLQADIDLLNPPKEYEQEKHKRKRLVQSPNSFFMDVK